MTQNLDAVIARAGFLDPNDPVAISFWIISIAMVASTVFFLMESKVVGSHWKTSLYCGALVTLVDFYMREFWVQIHSSPILYRYIDWSITVPLQMIESVGGKYMCFDCFVIFRKFKDKANGCT